MLMINCLPGDPLKGAIHEHDLERLHQAANGSLAIKSAASNPELFLRESALNLDGAINKLITETAMHFHSRKFHEDSRFVKFAQNLANYLKGGNKHLATLNYDNLIYNFMSKQKVLFGKKGHLIDGFFGEIGSPLVFDEKHLERTREKVGFYLHLHGSPLFVTKEDSIIKMRSDESRDVSLKTHIVLHHSSQKPYIIQNSRLLSTYWHMFERALSQTNFLIIFGYGGGDPHLNDRISSRANDRTLSPLIILIVEKAPEDLEHPRHEFWKTALGSENFYFEHLTNVLDFNFSTIDNKYKAAD